MNRTVVTTEEEIMEMIQEAISAAMQPFFEKMESQQEKPMEDRLLSIQELCKRWDRSKGTINNYMNQGIIPPMKIGRRVLFPMAEVLKAEANGLTKFR